jgi:hypothetical protein
LFMKFHLFGKSFGYDFSCFSKLLDFSKSCLPKSNVMRNFNKVEFSDAISRKSARQRFSDIPNPSLRFLHRWMSFTLFSKAELHSVTTPELKCLFAMVNRIKYITVADIVDYFTNVPKISGPIECTSLITQIAMNLGYSDLAYIEGDVPVLSLDHFIHAHILRDLTRPFDYILVKVLHYNLIGWERHATASEDHLALTCELIWRQHSRPRLQHRLTLTGH